MFLFGKKNKSSKENKRVIDIHSHILPYLDDGSKSMDMSIEMAKIAIDNGISDIVVTPHFKEYRPSANPDKVLETMKSLQRELDQRNLKLRLHLGNEIMRFRNIEEKLPGQILTMNSTDYVLVEFRPDDSFGRIREELSKLISMGYRPIMAHIERYECLVDDEDLVDDLIDMDVLIQTNYSTILGKYGKQPKKFVLGLLESEIIDFVSTDAHNDNDRSPSIGECVNFLYDRYDEEYVDRILYKNAMNILKIGE